MRKTEILQTFAADGSPGPVFTFKRPTFAGEIKFREWCRKKQRSDIAAGIPASGGCGLASSYGAQQALEDEEGMRLFLKIAATDDHADITDELLYDLQSNYYVDCLLIVLSLLPIGELALAAMKPEIREKLEECRAKRGAVEKKATS